MIFEIFSVNKLFFSRTLIKKVVRSQRRPGPLCSLCSCATDGDKSVSPPVLGDSARPCAASAIYRLMTPAFSEGLSSVCKYHAVPVSVVWGERAALLLKTLCRRWALKATINNRLTYIHLSLSSVAPRSANCHKYAPTNKRWQPVKTPLTRQWYDIAEYLRWITPREHYGRKAYAESFAFFTT